MNGEIFSMLFIHDFTKMGRRKKIFTKAITVPMERKG